MDYQGRSTFRIYLNEYVPSVVLNLRRVESVRLTFIQAEWQAALLVRQKFSDLSIDDILGDLISTANQMAMIIAGGVLTGGTIGAGVGVLGAGAGSIPLGLAGAALGLKISTWILGALGLASIAEFFTEGLPRIVDYYLEGINIAWRGPRGDDGLQPLSQDDPMAQSRAAHYIAMGHVEIIVLLLSGIVSYLIRGRGNVRALAQEMRVSDKGARLGQWMVKHEDNLKSRTDLHLSEPRKNAKKRCHSRSAYSAAHC